MTSTFPTIRFTGRLRPSQADVVEIARRQLEQGERRLYVVAPPGSGKTVLGLYLWAHCVRRPALVLSPNSAIQAQWAARLDLFDLEGSHERPVSTDPGQPGLFTSLTYQSVTLVRRGGDDLDALAQELWYERLIEKGQAKDPDEAGIWIDDLRHHNPEYYDERLAAYRKAVRDEIALGGEALRTLHASSLATIERLRAADVGLIILDECHHLLGHWGRVLAEAHEFLANPVVIGLTATPPDDRGKALEDVTRYTQFFGPVDYEVPVPAVVKDGFLATFQDLAYFVRPTATELAYIANTDDQLHALVEELAAEPDSSAADGGKNDQEEYRREPLLDWVERVLAELRLPTGTVKDWQAFENRDPEFSLMARVFLQQRGRPSPENVPELDEDVDDDELPEMSVLVPVLDRYVRHRLRRSPHEQDRALAEKATGILRSLGVQITETGTQACASPVGRVMAYSQSKVAALVPILTAELQALGESIRAIVVADFEKTSAVTTEIEHLLDEEAGGAVAAFRTLVSHETTDRLDPVLVTGASVLVDDDLAPKLLEAARGWLAVEGYEVELSCDHEEGFAVLNGRGGDWCPRVYVSLVTDLFQQGLTRCLVGTRGLLGEGWDADKVNVLIDLTTVTTSMSVNQLRGRSIRIDPDDPEKLADNWDVVCIAPEFTKGLDDYERFKKKHAATFGITDDGAIEKGVGHVHAAFTELKPEGLEGSVAALNDDMLDRVRRRAEVRAAWRVGEPYHAEPISTLEVRPSGGESMGFPPFGRRCEPWSSKSLALAVGRAVLGALEEAKLIENRREIHVGERDGGYVRLFLEEATEEESALFTESLHDALGPLHRPRYVIPRLVTHVSETWLSRLLPSVVGRYFQRRKSEFAMLHSVPAPLAKNKELAELFQKHWNRHVSPGEAVFALRGEGERILAEARRSNHTPGREIHRKEIFL